MQSTEEGVELEAVMNHSFVHNLMDMFSRDYTKCKSGSTMHIGPDTVEGQTTTLDELQQQFRRQFRTRELLTTAETDLAKCPATVKFMTAYNQAMKLQKLMCMSMDTSFNPG